MRLILTGVPCTAAAVIFCATGPAKKTVRSDRAAPATTAAVMLENPPSWNANAIFVTLLLLA